MLNCSVCNQGFPEQEFSGKQLKMKGKRRCKTCVLQMEEVCYFIKDTIDSGKGMFASRSMEANTCVHVESKYIMQPLETGQTSASYYKLKLADLIVENPIFPELCFDSDLVGRLQGDDEKKKQAIAKVHANCYTITDGMYLFPTISKMNHSCEPNCFIDREENHFLIRTLKKVKKNEELTLCYLQTGALVPKRQRSEQLLKQWNFVCKCSRCRNPEDPLDKALLAYNSDKITPEQMMFEIEEMNKTIQLLTSETTLTQCDGLQIAKLFRSTCDKLKQNYNLADSHWKKLELKMILLRVFVTYFKRFPKELSAVSSHIQAIQASVKKTLDEITPEFQLVASLRLRK